MQLKEWMLVMGGVELCREIRQDYSEIEIESVMPLLQRLS